MKNRAAVLMSVFTLLPLLGCNKPVTLPSPVPPGTTPTNLNGPIIQCGIDRQGPGGYYSDPIVTADILDSNYDPITTATVVMIAPGGANIPVTYMNYASFYEGPRTGWSYIPGQTYTFKVTIAGTTYTSSVVAPGGFTVPSPNSGSPITWAYEGNYDEVQISMDFSPYSITVNSVLSGFDASSPFSTASAYPLSGDYTVNLTCWRIRYSCFPNAHPGCMVSATDQYSVWVTKY